MRKSRFNLFIRQFNKRIFNRFSLLLSGYRYSPFYWSIIQHVGRKTGNLYATPIVAVVESGSIFIPLPYGKDVDWIQNILSKGSCKIKNGGEWYLGTKPQIINAEEALIHFPTLLQIALRMNKVENYLMMEQH
jgi:deazaflavin-dependent oxidoreductase (nitroreductase family)